MTLPPPPIDGSQAPPWVRWFQLLASIVKQVRLTEDGPVIAQGSGAPSSALPNGSLYLRSDGAGPNLYVRENGAWVAK
jgi:hypothetical protein